MFQEHLYSNRRCIGLTLLLWPHKGHRLKYEPQIELCFKLQGRPYWFLFFFSQWGHGNFTLLTRNQAESFHQGWNYVQRTPSPVFHNSKKIPHANFLPSQWIYTSKMWTPSSDHNDPPTPFHSFCYFSPNLTTPMGGLDYVPSAG